VDRFVLPARSLGLVEWVLAILAVLLFVSCAVVAAAVLAIRVVRRTVRPVVERASVSLRARAPGVGGDVARLRRDLHDATRRGRQAVAVADAIGGPVGDVPGLLDQIETAAADVDAELRAVAAVADPNRRLALIAPVQRRVADLVAAADDLAEAVAHAAAEARSDVGELRNACTAEAEALREGARVRESWSWPGG
jgi:hypothetical protein